MRAAFATSLLLAASACAPEPRMAWRDEAAPARARDFPLLRIATHDLAPVSSKHDYRHGGYLLLDADGTRRGALAIRGRGTSSWGMEKTSFRVELDEPAALCAMPGDRHWLLLANHLDRTLLRNEIAFELSRELGMEFTPRSRFVELELNGTYRGVYQLVEQIRIGKHRIDIARAHAADREPGDLTGGYLIEVDERRGEEFCIDSKRTGMVFCLRSPEHLLEPRWSRHREYIETYVHATERALFGDDFMDPKTGYAVWLDVDAAVDFYLVNEALANVDGDLRVSTFLYKKRHGKLTFGPVWDFDRALGNVPSGPPRRFEGWLVRKAPWFARLFADPGFAARVALRWQSWRAAGGVERLLDHVRQRDQELADARARNLVRWPSLADGEDRGGDTTAAMLAWFQTRVAWLDEQFEDAARPR